MEELITANLRSRPTRTLISIFAVAIGVILMLVIDGITSGTLNDTVNRTMGVGADFILQPSDSGMLFAFGSPALASKIADKVRETKGVGAVTPILAKFSMTDFGMVFGIDLPSYDQFPGSLRIVEGRRSLVGDEVIVDQLFARTHKIKPGMDLNISGHNFKVSGICMQGAVVREFVPLKTLQTLMETPDKISMVFIKAAPGTSLKDLEAELRKTFYGYHINTANDAALLLQGTKIPMLKEFSLAVIMVSMLISFMVILLAMYTTIFERTREIGILKSLGASRTFVVTMVLRESVMICFLGVLLGTGASQVIRKCINVAFPTLQVEMNLGEIAFACMLGIIAGVLGALYPAYKAARMDPVKALSYE
ncbi:MAG: efflux pump, inner rane subunit [Acidobacteria bacterium]|nr:efflux pump, inner rane subunit [Acidobacteriota bacterium]